MTNKYFDQRLISFLLKTIWLMACLLNGIIHMYVMYSKLNFNTWQKAFPRDHWWVQLEMNVVFSSSNPCGFFFWTNQLVCKIVNRYSGGSNASAFINCLLSKRQKWLAHLKATNLIMFKEVYTISNNSIVRNKKIFCDDFSFWFKAVIKVENFRKVFTCNHSSFNKTIKTGESCFVTKFLFTISGFQSTCFTRQNLRQNGCITEKAFKWNAESGLSESDWWSLWTVSPV